MVIDSAVPGLCPHALASCTLTSRITMRSAVSFTSRRSLPRALRAVRSWPRQRQSSRVPRIRARTLAPLPHGVRGGEILSRLAPAPPLSSRRSRVLRPQMHYACTMCCVASTFPAGDRSNPSRAASTASTCCKRADCGSRSSRFVKPFCANPWADCRGGASGAAASTKKSTLLPNTGSRSTRRVRSAGSAPRSGCADQAAAGSVCAQCCGRLPLKITIPSLRCGSERQAGLCQRAGRPAIAPFKQRALRSASVSPCATYRGAARLQAHANARCGKRGRAQKRGGRRAGRVRQRDAGVALPNTCAWPCPLALLPGKRGPLRCCVGTCGENDSGYPGESRVARATVGGLLTFAGAR